MDITGLLFHSLIEHGIDQADDGSLVRGIQQVRGLFEIIRQGVQVEIIIDVFDNLLGRV